MNASSLPPLFSADRAYILLLRVPCQSRDHVKINPWDHSFSHQSLAPSKATKYLWVPGSGTPWIIRYLSYCSLTLTAVQAAPGEQCWGAGVKVGGEGEGLFSLRSWSYLLSPLSQCLYCSLVTSPGLSLCEPLEPEKGVGFLFPLAQEQAGISSFLLTRSPLGNQAGLCKRVNPFISSPLLLTSWGHRL